MKQITKMSRLTGELEHLFRLLNKDFFNDQLPTPIITVIPTPRAYAHYVPFDIWQADGSGKREINIASGTLDRPIEDIVASLLHEMVHFYNDCVLNVQDTSGSSNAYHNKQFKNTAEQHALIVERHDRYGWAITAPSDRLLEWVLEHNELQEIKICRANPAAAVSIGTHTGSRNGYTIDINTPKHHTRKYVCPVCGNSVRATKKVYIGCLDCNSVMIEV